MEELFIRTVYDGKDLRQVIEIVYYDYDGEEVTHEAATNACFNLNTCTDMGSDTWETLHQMVTTNLRAAGISYESLRFHDDEPEL